MDSAVEAARDLVALFQFQSQRGHEHAATIVEVARALIDSHSQLERMREALEDARAFLAGEIRGRSQREGIIKTLAALTKEEK